MDLRQAGSKEMVLQVPERLVFANNPVIFFHWPRTTLRHKDIPMISACIIGISGFGRTHYNDLIAETEAGRMKPVAATIINQDEERERTEHLRSLGCEVFTDYREMLSVWSGRAELCFIPTGIYLHAPMSIAAMNAGMNVFVEKPAAGSIQDVRAMQKAERETGRFVAVGYQTMYATETMRMKEAIVSGALGEIITVKCLGLWPRMDKYYARNRWAGALTCDGAWVLDSPFNNALAHQLNMICFLAGTELRKSAQIASVEAELHHGHNIESADTAAIRATTATGAKLLFLVTHCSSESFGPEIVVRGTEGSIRWDFSTTTITSGDNRETFETEPVDNVRTRIMQRLRERIADPDTFTCDLNIAGTQTLVVNGAHESSPVRDIPAGFITRTPADDDVKTVITGIDKAMHQAFEQEKLFSELDVPWAVPGQTVDMTAYTSFEGGASS